MKGPGNIQRAYFIGIGGIGMSAIARYFHASGIAVAGYDRTMTPLTARLSSEGICVHYEDDLSLIPAGFIQPEGTFVIYTPAIPPGHAGLQYFRSHGFRVMKRSEMLGIILSGFESIAVAGSHGKTTVSSMIAHIMKVAGAPCGAFLGGISRNLGSNLLLHPRPVKMVVEADEFDRSFLTLYPQYAVITAMDADHLDIYGTHEAMRSSFNQFVAQVKPGGCLIYRKGLPLSFPEGIKVYSYSANEPADFTITDFRQERFTGIFSVRTPFGEIKDLSLGVYGRVNAGNALAALGIAMLNGIPENIIREALRTFSGVVRRFDVRMDHPRIVYIDDYAHHPEEIRAFIVSVKEALPGKRLTGVFQPHLYTRTRDFAAGFAESLSLLDDCILLDIYPAREEPIEGVTSGIIFGRLSNRGEKIRCSREALAGIIENINPEVLLTMGAGDIDQLTGPLEELLKRMYP